MTDCTLRAPSRSAFWRVCAAVLVWTTLGDPVSARADDARTFAVTVDGKPGGTYTISTAVAQDGARTVTVVARVQVKTALSTYTYELSSTEVWKNGRLTALAAKSNDDGKKHEVSARGVEGAIEVRVGRESKRVPADVLTATGVRVPAGDKPRDALLFDAEDGSTTAVKVEPLGACRVALNGRAIDGTKFKLTGKDVAGEWWFDADGGVIRQEMKWDGHKVVLELTGIK